MSYTYIPPTSIFEQPQEASSNNGGGPGKIIMLFSSTTRKHSNISSNPHVSLLVHDWSSHRPSQSTASVAPADGGFVTGSPPRSPSTSTGGASGLALLLQNLNSSSLSTHSHTIRGYAKILEDGSEEERYYRQKHVEGNQGEDLRCFIEGDEGSRVVVVDVEGGRSSDWKGGVTDWGLAEES